jgi:peptide/nickel transport system permease protein
MLRLFAGRILGLVPVAAMVVVFVFLLLRLSPGDPAVLIAGESATPDQIAQVRASLGLDQPITVQFLVWLNHLLHGNLGRSVFSNVKVTDLIAQRIAPTFSLALATMVLATCFAIPLGILAASRAGTWTDRVVMLFAVLAFSFPVFWTGYMLVLGFSVTWHLLPVQGFVPITQDIGGFFAHITLPAVTLGLAFAALLTRMTRASVLDVLGQDYIRTARAKGLKPHSVLFLHALKNAAIPIVTTIGLGIGILLGGTVVTESVFGIPGLGRLAVDAISTKDYPVIQGLILFFSLVYVVLNLLVDLACLALDPRIRA